MIRITQITGRALPDNHECGTITSTASRFFVLIISTVLKGLGQSIYALLQVLPQLRQQSSPKTSQHIGQRQEDLNLRQPEAAPVDMFTDEEEESTDDDGKGVEEPEERNVIECSPDFYKPTQLLNRRSGRTVARQGEVPLEFDDPTQLDSQDFERTYPAPRENRNKRKRTYHIIPADKEESVVKWYRDHEFLYNKKMRAYRDRDLKAKTWEDKGRSLNVKVSTLQTWITNMRTRYAKLVQTKSGQGTRELTERDAWIKESFNFLLPHIVRCTTRTSRKSAGCVEPQTSQVESQPAGDVGDEDEFDSASSRSRCLPPSGSLITSREKELLDKLTQAEERQRQLMQAWTAKKDEVPVAVQMIKDVHQLVSTTLGDIGVPLATVYVSDTVKYMLALCAYQNNTGPMPRVVVDESSSSGLGTSSQVYETMLPPRDFPRPNPPQPAPAIVKTECEEVLFPVKNGGQSHPNYIISENVNF